MTLRGGRGGLLPCPSVAARYVGHRARCRYSRPRRIASRLEHDIRDRVNLPNDRHVIVKAGRPRTSTVCMAHVEEQRTFNPDRDGGIIKVIRGSRQIVTEKAGIRGACRLQTSKARGV